MFILPIGMLEEHGPHLPIGADTFGVMFEADGVAKRISRPLQRWNVLMMPPLHYGKLRANAEQTFDELQEARDQARVAGIHVGARQSS